MKYITDLSGITEIEILKSINNILFCILIVYMCVTILNVVTKTFRKRGI